MYIYNQKYVQSKRQWAEILWRLGRYIRLCAALFSRPSNDAKRLSVLVFVSQTLLRPLLFLRTETLAVAYISVLIP